MRHQGIMAADVAQIPGTVNAFGLAIHSVRPIIPARDLTCRNRDGFAETDRGVQVNGAR